MNDKVIRDQWHAVSKRSELSEGPSLSVDLLEERIVFQDMIFLQDKDLLESQLLQRLPLETRAEKHQRTDKASVEYRRWLKKLGVHYETQ